MINCSKLIYVLVAKKFQIFHNNFDIWPCSWLLAWLPWLRCVLLTIVCWLAGHVYTRSTATICTVEVCVCMCGVHIGVPCIEVWPAEQPLVGWNDLLFMDAMQFVGYDDFSTIAHAQHTQWKQCDQFTCDFVTAVATATRSPYLMTH